MRQFSLRVMLRRNGKTEHETSTALPLRWATDESISLAGSIPTGMVYWDIRPNGDCVAVYQYLDLMEED